MPKISDQDIGEEFLKAADQNWTLRTRQQWIALVLREKRHVISTEYEAIVQAKLFATELLLKTICEARSVGSTFLTVAEWNENARLVAQLT